MTPTGKPPTAPTLRGISRRSVLASAVAAAAGIAVGVAVNVASPNPVYGFQLIADGVAIVAALIVFAVPSLRAFRAAAIGLAIGVVAGVAIGMNLVARPNPSMPGSVQVRLGEPENVDSSVEAVCFVTDGVLVNVVTADDGRLRLADGRWFSITIGTEKQEPAATDRPLEIGVTISGTLPDGSPTETRMTSDASSTVSITNAGATGSMAFSGLVLHELSELRTPIDVAGTVTWDCQP